MAVEANPRYVLAGSLKEVGLDSGRFVDVTDGGKKCLVDHTNPSNQHGPEGISGNYGVETGGELAIPDVDDYAADDGATDALDELPDTLTIETPHTDGVTGGHRYYEVVPGVEFESAREACNAVWDGVDNPVTAWGELRVHNQYTVGPGSHLDDCKHGCCTPADPGRYRIAADRPITTITADDLADVLRSDPKRPSDASGGTKPASTPTAAPVSPIEYDDDAAAVVGHDVREFQNNAETATRAFENVIGLARGNYTEWGHDNRSDAELSLASKLYGILRFTGDDENTRQRIYSFITDACESRSVTDDGQTRKWVERGDRYRFPTIDAAVETFDQDRWDRWRLSKENPYQLTGEYGDPIYRYVLRAVQVAYEERPGYPSKDDVLDAAQGLNPERAKSSHGEVLKLLQREREQVKAARFGRWKWGFYPASEKDPADASYYLLGGEKHDLP